MDSPRRICYSLYPPSESWSLGVSRSTGKDMPTYESVLILKPQLSDHEVNELMEKTKKIISGEGGEVLAEDRWGRRKLSAPIRANREGNYIQLKFSGAAGVIGKLGHHCRVTDAILRNLTVRLEPVKEKRKTK